MIEKSEVIEELEKLTADYGSNPLEYFHILVDKPHKVLNFDLQNKLCSDLKSESWHGLNLNAYWMWALTDNGEYLFWDGQQMILMEPKDFSFTSLHTSPFRFMRNLMSGRNIEVLPAGLVSSSA